MTLDLITIIEGFFFYQLKPSDYYELWIMNKEASQMRYLYGSTKEFTVQIIKDLYRNGYFDSWIYDEDFTDQEDF